MRATELHRWLTACLIVISGWHCQASPQATISAGKSDAPPTLSQAFKALQTGYTQPGTFSSDAKAAAGGVFYDWRFRFERHDLWLALMLIELEPRALRHCLNAHPPTGSEDIEDLLTPFLSSEVAWHALPTKTLRLANARLRESSDGQLEGGLLAYLLRCYGEDALATPLSDPTGDTRRLGVWGPEWNRLPEASSSPNPSHAATTGDWSLEMTRGLTGSTAVDLVYTPGAIERTAQSFAVIETMRQRLLKLAQDETHYINTSVVLDVQRTQGDVDFGDTVRPYLTLASVALSRHIARDTLTGLAKPDQLEVASELFNAHAHDFGSPADASLDAPTSFLAAGQVASKAAGISPRLRSRTLRGALPISVRPETIGLMLSALTLAGRVDLKSEAIGATWDLSYALLQDLKSPRLPPVASWQRQQMDVGLMRNFTQTHALNELATLGARDWQFFAQAAQTDLAENTRPLPYSRAKVERRLQAQANNSAQTAPQLTPELDTLIQIDDQLKAWLALAIDDLLSASGHSPDPLTVLDEVLSFARDPAARL